MLSRTPNGPDPVVHTVDRVVEWVLPPTLWSQRLNALCLTVMPVAKCGEHRDRLVPLLVHERGVLVWAIIERTAWHFQART